jgi:putative SOS response-associated peptidase YedK
MCGRFTQHYTWAELVALYGLTQPAPNLNPHYNIAPTDTVEIVIRPRGKCRGGGRTPEAEGVPAPHAPDLWLYGW